MKKLLATLIIFLFCSELFAQIKVSQLPNITGNNTDSVYVHVLQNGSNKKARGWQLNGSIKSDSTTFTKSPCRTIVKVWRNGSVQQVDTFYKPSGVVSGGTFTRLNDTIFRIAATNYFIDCRNLNLSEQNIILNGNSDSSKGRIDVIGVDTSGNPFVLQGINSIYPAPRTVNPLTQIGLLTVTFPANSDYGITNIYNTNVYNVEDSSALNYVVAIDSFNVDICNLRGNCYRITTVYTGEKYLDSTRLSNDSVFALKNGTWRFQYKLPATGTTGTLDLTLRAGNTTRQEYRIIDSPAVASTSLRTWSLEPSNMRTNYGTRGTAMGFRSSYNRYNGVNGSGRPNVVYDIFSYNGGFNSPDSTNEASYRIGFETHFETGGANLFEMHFGEFKPRLSSLSLRPLTLYMNKDNGFITADMQVAQLVKYMGGLTALGDTVNFLVNPTQMTFGSRGAGSFIMKNQDSTDNYFAITKALTGANFVLNTPSTGAASVSYFGFNSPIQVATSTTYGTTNGAAIQATVGNANAYGLKIAQSGLTTSNFGGVYSDVNTSGTFSLINGRILNATGTLQTLLNAGNGAIAQYALSDNGNGIPWRIYLKSGDADREMAIGFGTSTYDSLMKFRGTDGKISIRTNLNVGSTGYADPSAALQVTSTTQGFLPPVMTATQASAISSPVDGLLIYVTDTNGTFTAVGFYGRVSGAWSKLN